MQFNVSIDSDDWHADQDPRGLVVSSLGDIAKLVEVGHDEGILRDDSGNKVGRWSLEITETDPTPTGIYI
jgi:hypothetical protein